jgi:DNA-binding transcriptional ArsR family regulator
MSMDDETYSVMFASLKHPIRRKILRILASSPKAFSEILQQVDIESAHLSYHLDGLDGLLKKTAEGKYVLSNLGRAGLSLMARIEEPVSLVSPAFLKTPHRLKIARISFIALAVLGIILLGNGVFALSSTNIQKTMIQTASDSDFMVFQPGKVTGWSSYIYFGDGLYGVEVNLVMRDAYSKFPLIVRLSTPLAGNYTNADYWNQSFYEWTRADQPPVPGIREELSLTLLAQGGTFKITSQSSFDHVHPSPGEVIGQFRQGQNAAVLFKVAPEIGNANVTLSGFRAFQIKWFYFPQPEDAVKNAFFLLGSGLAISSVGFVMGSRYLEPRRGKEAKKTSP